MTKSAIGCDNGGGANVHTCMSYYYGVHLCMTIWETWHLLHI